MNIRLRVRYANLAVSAKSGCSNHIPLNFSIHFYLALLSLHMPVVILVLCL